MGCGNSKEKKQREFPPQRDPYVAAPTADAEASAFPPPVDQKNESTDASTSAQGKNSSQVPPVIEEDAMRNDVEPEGSIIKAETAIVEGSPERSNKYPGPTGYRLCGPSVEGNVTPCFNAGMLYRIVDGDCWYYYNDSQDYEMHIQVQFGAKSDIQALKKTEANINDEGQQVLSLIVYPAETEPFMQGSYDGYKCNMNAKPLSMQYRSRIWENALIGIKSEVQKFKGATRNADNIDKIIELCIKNNVRFVDLEFPPSQEILCRDQIDIRKVPIMVLTRHSDLAPKGIGENITFGSPDGHLDCSQISEGALGDLWVLCAAICLSEHPEAVARFLRHPNPAKMPHEHAVGCFRVNMNVNGWWQNIYIDDFIPSIGGRPTFAHSLNRTDFFISAVEKAYAKAHGSYSAITAGDGIMALQDFTGFPVTRFDTEWEEALRDKKAEKDLLNSIKSYLESGYSVALNTPGYDASGYDLAAQTASRKDFEFIYESVGLRIGHMYSLIQVKSFPEHELVLFNIRNPWEAFRPWNGAWSQQSDSWDRHPDVEKEIFGSYDERSGSVEDSFWMSWEDVKKYFDGGGVLFNRFNYHDYRIRGTFFGHVPSVAVEINVREPCEMMLILSQKDRHGLPTNDPDSRYSAVMLSVSRQSGNKQAVHLNSNTNTTQPSEAYTFNFSRDHSLIYKFTPENNPHLIIPRIYPNAGGMSSSSSQEKQFVLGLLSELPSGSGFTATFKQLPANCKVFDNYPKFLYNGHEIQDTECEWQSTTIDTFFVEGTGTGLPN